MEGLSGKLAYCNMASPNCFDESQFWATPRASSLNSSVSYLPGEARPKTRWVDMTCHARTTTYFRFQLVACELLTCEGCTRHFITPSLSTVVCPKCHHLNDRSLHLESINLFDMERLLLSHGLFYSGCPTSLNFMRLKIPKRYPAAEDEWSTVVVLLCDTALRIYELDNSLAASFSWGSLSLHFSEHNEAGVHEMILKDRTSRRTLSAATPGLHRWLKSRILNKLKLFSTHAILDNSFSHFRPVQVPAEPPKPAKPAKAFLSRLRNGKFLRKREIPFSPPPCPAPRSEALMPFSARPGLSKKVDLPVFLHRLASRSLPNIALTFSPKKGSRISASTFATHSSEESVGSPTSNLGLDFLFSSPFPEPEESEPSLVHFLLNHPAVCQPEKPHNWQPVASSTLPNHGSSEEDDDELPSAPQSPVVSRPLFPPHAPQSTPPSIGSPPVLDSPASLLPPQVRHQMFRHLQSKAKAGIQLRSSLDSLRKPPPQANPTHLLGSHSLTYELDLLLDMFPTPPNR